MPLPLTVSCFSKIQIGFTFLVPAHLGSPEQWAVKRVCVCISHKARKSQLEGEGAKFAENSNNCLLIWKTGTGN